MKFTILAEDHCRNEACGCEHGLSFYIEADGEKILLDTGVSDLYIKNAQALGVDLDAAKTLVISHGHHDHVGGIKYLKGKRKLVLHPGCFTKRYKASPEMPFAGMRETKEELSENFDIIETKEVYKLTENVWFLGEVARLYEVPDHCRPSVLWNREPDELNDDTGLVVKTDKGLVVFASCSHSGIHNIVDHAIRVTGIEDVYAVIGGFHMRKADYYVDEIADFFKARKVQTAYMGHCTEDPIIDLFEEKLQGSTRIIRMYSGAQYEI